MAKLVGVYHDESPDSSGVRRHKASCLARRQVPLTIENGLTMIMALDDACLACGGGASSAGTSTPSSGSPSGLQGSRTKSSKNGSKVNPEREVFLRKYETMGKDELSAAFMVTFDDLLAVLGTEIPCVGCRRSVEALLQKLYETCDSALEPLVITEDALVSVSRDHILAPFSLANLFCDQMQKLESNYKSGLSNFKNKKSNRVGRCGAHSLGIGNKKAMSLGHWLDTWECMERECQEEVVLIHFDLLRQTLDRYLKKHSFCSECTNMVNKAYSLLVDDDFPLPEGTGECTGNHYHEEGNGDNRLKSRCCDDTASNSSSDTLSLSPTPPPSHDGGCSSDRSVVSKSSNNLYKGITACPADQHVHVECTPSFVSKLITMAEPELSGLRQERHAKTIEIAQKEVLTCIGICLYERFQRIQQRLREGQQACDLLFLMALKSLKKSFEMAFENKQGISDLEKFCQELDEEERRKQEKAQKKRDKKSKQTAKKKKKEKQQELRQVEEPGTLANGFKEEEEDEDEDHTPPAPLPTLVQASPTKDCSKKVLGKNRTRIPANKELPSLESMLIANDKYDDYKEDPTDNEENFIPIEDIQEFRARMPVVARQREELRKTLRLRFNQLCVNGL